MTRPLRTAARFGLAGAFCALAISAAPAGAMGGRGGPPSAPAQPAPAQPAPAQALPAEPERLAPGQVGKPFMVDPEARAAEEKRAAEAKARAQAALSEDERRKAVQKPAAQWYRGNRVLLEIEEPSAGIKARWQFERSTANDIRVVIDEQRKAGPQRGTLLLIGQKALLTRSLQLARPGSALPAIDGPALLLNLTLRMLERAVPGGPQSLRGERVVKVADPSVAIVVDTPTAQGLFLAPWTLTGKVRPTAEGVAFDFVLRSRSRTDPDGFHSTALRGTWQLDDRAPPAFGDDLSLEGWQLHSIQPAPGDARSPSPPLWLAVPRPGFQTLGELRQALGRGWPENAPAAAAAPVPASPAKAPRP
ncbi:MAG: hypothetical protein ACK5TE_14830 [Pseudomonadota bacterium]|jgi:hypothetical protein